MQENLFKSKYDSGVIKMIKNISKRKIGILKSWKIRKLLLSIDNSKIFIDTVFGEALYVKFVWFFTPQLVPITFSLIPTFHEQ